MESPNLAFDHHLFVNGAVANPGPAGLRLRPRSSLDVPTSGLYSDTSSPTRPTSANGVRLPSYPSTNGSLASPHHAAAAAAAAHLFAPHYTPLPHHSHHHHHLLPHHEHPPHLGLAPVASSPMMSRTLSSPAAMTTPNPDALFTSIYQPSHHHATSPAAVAAAAAAAAAAAHAAAAVAAGASPPTNHVPVIPRAASYASIAPPPVSQPGTPAPPGYYSPAQPVPSTYWSPHLGSGGPTSAPPPLVNVTASPYPPPSIYPVPTSSESDGGSGSAAKDPGAFEPMRFEYTDADDASPAPLPLDDRKSAGAKADRGPLMPVYFHNDDGSGGEVGIMMSARTLEQLEQQREEAVYDCEFCDKVYSGKHARSIWRRHLSDKHQIPLSSQPRRTRWDNVDANRPKSEAERRERTLESKRRWARKNRAEKRAIREAGLAVPKTARDISATAASLGFTAESAAKARLGKKAAANANAKAGKKGGRDDDDDSSADDYDDDDDDSSSYDPALKAPVLPRSVSAQAALPASMPSMTRTSSAPNLGNRAGAASSRPPSLRAPTLRVSSSLSATSNTGTGLDEQYSRKATTPEPKRQRSVFNVMDEDEADSEDRQGFEASDALTALRNSARRPAAATATAAAKQKKDRAPSQQQQTWTEVRDEYEVPLAAAADSDGASSPIVSRNHSKLSTAATSVAGTDKSADAASSSGDEEGGVTFADSSAGQSSLLGKRAASADSSPFTSPETSFLPHHADDDEDEEVLNAAKRGFKRHRSLEATPTRGIEDDDDDDDDEGSSVVAYDFFADGGFDQQTPARPVAVPAHPKHKSVVAGARRTKSAGATVDELGSFESSPAVGAGADGRPPTSRAYSYGPMTNDVRAAKVKDASSAIPTSDGPPVPPLLMGNGQPSSASGASSGGTWSALQTPAVYSRSAAAAAAFGSNSLGLHLAAAAAAAGSKHHHAEGPGVLGLGLESSPAAPGGGGLFSSPAQPKLSRSLGLIPNAPVGGHDDFYGLSLCATPAGAAAAVFGGGAKRERR